MRVFFVVPARDFSGVTKKLEEIDSLGYPCLIVCGQEVNHPNVLYRPVKGKYDALNYGFTFVPSDTEVVVFNDVDTEIYNFSGALDVFRSKDVSLVFAKVKVASGPQAIFYSFLDPLRRIIPIAASGELILIRYDCIKSIMPIKACKAEDSYILFRVLEQGRKAVLNEDCYVTTRRTLHAEEEETYKRRTVGGIYQALALTKPPAVVKLFYTLLPFLSLLLITSGKKGFFWFKGILLGFVDYLRGDTAASWQPIHSYSKDVR
jgi:hypothetical protein